MAKVTFYIHAQLDNEHEVNTEPLEMGNVFAKPVADRYSLKISNIESKFAVNKFLSFKVEAEGSDESVIKLTNDLGTFAKDGLLERYSFSNKTVCDINEEGVIKIKIHNMGANQAHKIIRDGSYDLCDIFNQITTITSSYGDEYVQDYLAAMKRILPAIIINRICNDLQKLQDILLISTK